MNSISPSPKKENKNKLAILQNQIGGAMDGPLELLPSFDAAKTSEKVISTAREVGSVAVDTFVQDFLGLGGEHKPEGGHGEGGGSPEHAQLAFANNQTEINNFGDSSHSETRAALAEAYRIINEAKRARMDEAESYAERLGLTLTEVGQHTLLAEQLTPEDLAKIQVGDVMGAKLRIDRLRQMNRLDITSPTNEGPAPIGFMNQTNAGERHGQTVVNAGG